jgi:hypothetical protein
LRASTFNLSRNPRVIFKFSLAYTSISAQEEVRFSCYQYWPVQRLVLNWNEYRQHEHNGKEEKYKEFVAGTGMVGT